MVALPTLAKDSILLSKDKNYYSSDNSIFECIVKNITKSEISPIFYQSAKALLLRKKINHFDYIIESGFNTCRMRMENDYYQRQYSKLLFNGRRIRISDFRYLSKASLFYFGKNIEELDIAQTAYLAGLAGSSRAPVELQEDTRLSQGAWYAIDQLVANAKIAAAQAEVAKNEQINLRTPSK